MNYIIIQIPDWFLYAILALIVIQLVNSGLKVYEVYLKNKLK